MTCKAGAHFCTHGDTTGLGVVLTIELKRVQIQDKFCESLNDVYIKGMGLGLLSKKCLTAGIGHCLVCLCT